MEIESASFEPYQFRAKLYVMHLCFVFTSRMWDMGIVFLLADLTDNSMGVVALAGLLTNLSIVLFMPRLGALLDQTNRLVASEVALGVKFLTLTTAYAVCAYLAHDSHDPAHEYLVYLLPVLCAVAGLSFNTISQSVEKDWIVVLSAGDSAWLSLTNSVLTQIDSAVNSVAPAVTGFIFLACSQTQSALVLLGANLVASALLYFFLRDVYASWPALARRSHDPPPSVKAPSIAAASNKAAIAADAPATSSASFVACCSLRDYDDFRQSGCASAMVAYAFLFLTVLNFGSLMTVFLRSTGLSDGWIGLARGVGAFTGLLGAVVFPFVTSCFGLYRTSAMAIALQDVLVVAAALSFFVCPPHVVVAVLVFAVLFSRTGLWIFDLGVRQIAQETIPAHCRGKVNGQWRSMTAFFEMASYVLALLVRDARHFWVLTTVSAAMVTAAMLLFVVGGGSGRSDGARGYRVVDDEAPALDSETSPRDAKGGGWLAAATSGRGDDDSDDDSDDDDDDDDSDDDDDEGFHGDIELH